MSKKNKKKSAAFSAVILILAAAVFFVVKPNIINDKTSSEQAAESDNSLFSSYSEAVSDIKSLKISFFDVGQADSIYLELPDGSNMLIDAGNNLDGPNIVNYLKNTKGVSEITHLVSTHAHEDHIGGLSNVIKSFDIKNIYMPQMCEADMPTTAVYENVLDTIGNKNYYITPAKKGENIVNAENLSIDILSPSSDNYKGNLNNYSIVLRLKYYDTVMLFMGDAEKAVEEEILASGENIDADLIKIGHHGSATSTIDNFFEAVSPMTAIISCGVNNKYGFPSEAVISKLYNSEIETYRTDTMGTIKVTCSDKGYFVEADDTVCLDGDK